MVACWDSGRRQIAFFQSLEGSHGTHMEKEGHLRADASRI